MMTRSSITHLDLDAVLVNAWLYNWEVQPNGDVVVLLKSVNLFDYETGKKLLAPTLDHCWLWIAENHWWQHLWEVAATTGEKLVVHDKVWLCCTFGHYRRSDGSSGWRIRPRNQCILSPPQARKLQKANTDLYRKAPRLKGRDLMNHFTRQCIYLTELGHMATDWRKLGRSYKNAYMNVKRNLKALEQQIGAKPDGLDSLMEGFYTLGSLAVRQMYERIADAEQLKAVSCSN